MLHGDSLTCPGTPANPHSDMDVVNLDAAPPFVTKDGSEIRELLAHRNSIIRNQSLAEAHLQPGQATEEHYHAKTEEIYYITQGTGRLRVGEEIWEVRAGDAIAIPPDNATNCGTPAQSPPTAVLLPRLTSTATPSSPSDRMKPKSIRLFIKPYCGWCDEVMEWFAERGIPYETLDVTRNAAARRRDVGTDRTNPRTKPRRGRRDPADFGADELETWWQERDSEPQG